MKNEKVLRKLRARRIMREALERKMALRESCGSELHEDERVKDGDKMHAELKDMLDDFGTGEVLHALLKYIGTDQIKDFIDKFEKDHAKEAHDIDEDRHEEEYREYDLDDLFNGLA